MRKDANKEFNKVKWSPSLKFDVINGLLSKTAWAHSGALCNTSGPVFSHFLGYSFGLRVIFC